MQEIGLEAQRLQMINISSAMAGQFAFAAAEITAEIQRIGPNPLGSNGQSSTTETGSQVEGEGTQVTDASHDRNT